MEQPKLLDQVRNKTRLKHYNMRTEEAYVHWVKRFALLHHKRHPRDMSATEVEQFLTSLAVKGKVSASTQNKAKSALLFLYKEALHVQLPSDRISRHHADDKLIQRSMRQALQKAGIHKTATPHTLLHSFAAHVLNKGGHDVVSPLDAG